MTYDHTGVWDKAADDNDFECRKRACRDPESLYAEARLQSTPRCQPFWTQEVLPNVTVVRDDLLCGGTKERVALQMILDRPGVREFVYPTSAYGGAQVALSRAAWIARRTYRRDQKAVIFVPRTRPARAFTRTAASLGARIENVDPGDDPRDAAWDYVGRHARDAWLVPNGLGTDETVDALCRFATSVRDRLGVFDECWCAVGSGTLWKALSMSGLARDAYYGVCVFGTCPPVVGKGMVPVIPEQPIDDPAPENKTPPFPSASHYDAKIWQHVLPRLRTTPSRRILVWNVM